MSLLAIIIVLVSVVVVAVVAVVAGRLLYIRQVRRSLVKLLGRREAIIAAANGVENVLEHLLSADDETLAAFAGDPASEDRRAMADVASRMRILADDLHVLALPKRLWPSAEKMEDAARTLSAQTAGVGEATGPEGALGALAGIRLADVRSRVDEANKSLEPLLEAFKVSDPAVYGGGLYI